MPSIFPVSTMDGAEGYAAWRQWDKDAYHTPQDDMTQVFDWQSGARFTRMVFLTTWMAADGERAPEWNEGDFFGKRYGR